MYVYALHLNSTTLWAYPPSTKDGDQRRRLIGTFISSTVKAVLSGHSKIDKTNILTTNGSQMKAERIAECSPWSILQYF